MKVNILSFHKLSILPHVLIRVIEEHMSNFMYHNVSKYFHKFYSVGTSTTLSTQTTFDNMPNGKVLGNFNQAWKKFEPFWTTELSDQNPSEDF